MASPAAEAQQLLQVAGSAVDALEKGFAQPDNADAAIGRAREFIEATNPAALDPMARRKLDAVRQDLDLLSNAVDRVRRRAAKAAQQQQERDELMRRLNPSAAPHSDHEAGQAHLAKEQESLQHTRRHVQNLTEENHAVLSALQAQRRRMEGTGAKLEGVLQGIGVSDEAILQIRRMSGTDRLIVMMGVFFLVVLMLYLWFF